MGIVFSATGTVPYGKVHFTNRNTLKVGQPDGDYAVLKGVDFGKGKKGVRISHKRADCGVSLVEMRLDKLNGKSIGVCACAGQDVFGNTLTAWAEIDKTEGIHDVYLVFERVNEYTHFEFTEDSPYDKKVYTPVPEKCLKDNLCDTWEATDMLGRKVPTTECRDRRDKKVGIFYWTWHEAMASTEPQDLTKILAEFPEAEWDMKHHIWKDGCNHWGEPLFGYYRDTDPYVIRKHAAMLSAAGVDFIAFDNTNGAGTKKEAYMPLLEGLRLAKLDGIKVPQIVFLMNFWVNKTTEYMLRSVYQDLYKPGLYSDLWFRVDGKPLVLAKPDSIPKKGVNARDTKFLNEIRDFFTFRQPQPGYKTGPQTPDEWGWLESAPQHKFGERPDGSFEQMTVGVAQNQNPERACTHFNAPNTFGRSYTSKTGNSLLTEDSYLYGYNFQEQWDNAHEADPDHVFVTGWNEWIMGRFHDGWVKEEGSTQVAFVDQFSYEKSRDIEPSKEGYLDTYYLQLCANVRKFKGTAKQQKASGEKTVKITDGAEQWNKVAPTFHNLKGFTQVRRYPGFGPTIQYQNESGRNDIVEAKVARDKENVYFAAWCSENIVDKDKENCMMLFVDTDRSKETGWEGYDYRICGKNLEKNVDGYTWEKVATVKKSIKGNLVQIAVKKKDLKLEDSFDIEFKWSDNNFSGAADADVMRFYTHGVSAPIGRFNYRYKV